MNVTEVAAARGFELRAELEHADLLEIEAIQREVWGPDDMVPAPHLRAVEHAGGQLAAAFRDGRMIGFAYGFLAAPHGRAMRGAGLHSHMVAVRDEGRRAGVGQALKWFQREWCLERGLSWISWTFDPLQARNARLNLEHLGAVARDYLPDFYGPMGGPLGGGQSSDRLLALWQLGAPRVVARVPGQEDAEPSRHVTAHDDALPWAVRAAGDTDEAEPLIAAVPAGAEAVRVAVPRNSTALLHERPELARRWRTAVRVAMAPLLEQGYVAAGFEAGGYVIKRDLEE